MKTLLIVLLGLSTIPTQQLKKEKQTLFDFRTSDVRSSPKITKATERLIMRKVREMKRKAQMDSEIFHARLNGKKHQRRVR